LVVLTVELQRGAAVWRWFRAMLGKKEGEKKVRGDKSPSKRGRKGRAAKKPGAPPRGTTARREERKKKKRRKERKPVGAGRKI